MYRIGEQFFCSEVDRTGRSYRHSPGHQGVSQWRYAFRKNASGRLPRNLFNKPDFVVAEPDAKDELIIRRASFIPPVFNIIEAGRIIGAVKMRSFSRNQYSISVGGTNLWIFRMPLFTIRFYGESSGVPEIWIVVGPSETEGIILMKEGAKERPLVAALAFIHNERWHYG